VFILQLTELVDGRSDKGLWCDGESEVGVGGVLDIL
jgi:hypothetical protein